MGSASPQAGGRGRRVGEVVREVGEAAEWVKFLLTSLNHWGDLGDALAEPR